LPHTAPETSLFGRIVFYIKFFPISRILLNFRGFKILILRCSLATSKVKGLFIKYIRERVENLSFDDGLTEDEIKKEMNQRKEKIFTNKKDKKKKLEYISFTQDFGKIYPLYDYEVEWNF